MKIAVIPPLERSDYMTNTVVDGLDSLRLQPVAGQPAIEFALPRGPYAFSGVHPSRLAREAFVKFAREADLIIFMGGRSADTALAEEIDRFDGTVFIDGSEVGKNRRFDGDIMKQVFNLTYTGQGAVDKEMLRRCALYFRREKPYGAFEGKAVIPLPFGIERRYVRYKPGTVKKIDFACVFGQDQYPLLRREVREYLETFCREKNLNCRTRQTGLPLLDIYTSFARKRFHSVLAKSKAGISVGGGGFDTMRFWEILGNNCMLITETIDIFEPGSKALDYSRILQFNDLQGFKDRLAETTQMLRSGHDPASNMEEYRRILDEHSTHARVMTIIREAERAGIIA